jgi:L-cysteine:1D-myo-inositol 2-amino-2-deoxy-alpha-D-glucopyranoside ligase
MLTVFAERGGDPSVPGSATRSTRCCGALNVRTSRRGTARPWARADPGWHIECTAISPGYLGMPFTVQGGGSRPDLPAPRDERGAGCALTGTRPFAEVFVHQAMVASRARR